MANSGDEAELNNARAKRVVKPSYPFMPRDPNLLAKGKILARGYNISFNQLLSFLLENAYDEWSVPFMEKRERTEEGGSEKPLTKRDSDRMLSEDS